MKKHLRKIITAFIIVFSSFANAQSLNETFVKQLVPYHPNLNLQATNASRNTMCGTDTILYPYLKELVFASPNDSFFVDAMVGNVRTASQAYLLNDTITVKGIQFWGGAYSTSTLPQTLQARGYLYNVDNMNMPTTLIDSGDVTVTQTFDFYELTFATPRTVTGNFAVAVKSVPNDTLAVITNNADNVWTVPNYGEGLAWRRFGSGTWNSALSFFGQDLEYMIFPIVEYTIDVNLNTTSNDSICEGDSITFTNDYSPILQNRMFNLIEFDSFWSGMNDTTFLWNFGDGDTAMTANTGHRYNTAGTYTPKVYGRMTGYYTSCVDSAWMTLVVMPEVVGGFSVNSASEPTFTFNDTSSNATSYMWDFGDGNTSTDPSPMHTYTANGTYTVTQIVDGFCGGDTNTTVVNVISIGVNASANDMIRSFYSSNDHSLVIESGFAQGTVQVYDMIGKSVLNTNLASKSQRINVSNLPEGSYIVKVTSGNVTKSSKFVMIK